MHGSLAENQARLAELADALKAPKAQVAVFAPSPYLAQCQVQLSDSPIAWGAQTLSEHEQGAYTGEVSASMLKDFGCSMVLVGHSERRELFGETDAAIAEKFKKALADNLIPVLCVGETLEQRESGKTLEVIQSQIQAVMGLVGVEGFGKSVIAYEPVWAIGTGLTASPEQAQEVHASIRALLAQQNGEIAQTVRILYGGSVKPSNAADIFAQPDVDGALVGGASLVASDFIAICNAVA